LRAFGNLIGHYLGTFFRTIQTVTTDGKRL
jgi:hypothetical protein